MVNYACKGQSQGKLSILSYGIHVPNIDQPRKWGIETFPRFLQQAKQACSSLLRHQGMSMRPDSLTSYPPRKGSLPLDKLQGDFWGCGFNACASGYFCCKGPFMEGFALKHLAKARARSESSRRSD